MAQLAVHDPQRTIPAEADEDELAPEEVVRILDGYRNEGQEGRRSGPSPRDQVWAANWDRYWGRYDNSKKADWQSKHVMPEAPQFVDRWAAAMREALDSGGAWFAAVDEAGTRNDLMPHVDKLMRILLSRCARTASGHTVDFNSIFEDQMKLGALMQLSAAVTAGEDGWPLVESVDPREVWLDPKLRNLYRLREYHIDKHELTALAQQADDEGNPIYDLKVIGDLANAVDEEQAERERTAGHGRGQGGTVRVQIKIQEWLCDLLNQDGETVAGRSLVVVANDRHLIRKPEPNPFWHGQDWVVTCPMVPVPLSAYGRTYMEDWADVADAFVDMTNIIMDGTVTSTLKAFAALPHLLENPAQIDEGVYPNVVFKLSDEAPDLKQFMTEIDLGTMPAESFRVWQALKQELREGAKLSEIALGQHAPNQGTTATEITSVTQSGSAMIRSMARTIETRFLEPVLTLVWQTALQHMDFAVIADEIGEETAAMLNTQREEFRDSKIRFRVRGISELIDRNSQLRSLLSMLQVVGQNEALLTTFLEKVDAGKLLDQMFQLFGVDVLSLQLTPQERALRQFPTAAAPGGQPAPQQ